MRSGERRGRFGADQPGADDDDPPAQVARASRRGRRGRHRRCSPRLARSPEWAASDSAVRSPRRASAPSSSSGSPPAARRDDQVTAVEIAVGHDPVDVLDALLDELGRVGEQRNAAGQERALRERRPVVGQARPDHGHARASLSEAGGARIPGDAVADDDDVSHTTHISGSWRRPRRWNRRSASGKAAGGARRVADAAARPPEASFEAGTDPRGSCG